MLSEVSQSQLLFAAQGSTMDGLNMHILGELPIAFPPMDEQVDILSQTKKRAEKFDSLLNRAEQEVILLQERRTALISAAEQAK